MKVYPTHHVLFDDGISGVCQGWRYASVTKTGTKWTYFRLFDGTDHTYKVKNKKWESLKKHITDKTGQKIIDQDTDHEIVIEPKPSRKKSRVSKDNSVVKSNT